MPIVIDDCPGQTAGLNSLFEGAGVKFLNEATLIAELKKIVFGQLELNSTETLFLYPGESARRLKDMGFSQGFISQELFAKRIWTPGSEPVILVHSMPWGIYSELQNIVVVDDVISSGTTLALVRERNAWKFPRAIWYGAAPVTRKEKLKGFKKIFSCLLVKEVSGRKVPINSLSTLLNDCEVRKSYFARNFCHDFERKFLEAVEQK